MRVHTEQRNKLCMVKVVVGSFDRGGLLLMT